MDGLFQGKPYEQMDDLGVFPLFPLFLEGHPWLSRSLTASALMPALQLLNGSLLFTFLEGCCWPGVHSAVEHIEWKRGGSVEEVLGVVYFDGFFPIFCVFLLVRSKEKFLCKLHIMICGCHLGRCVASVVSCAAAISACADAAAWHTALALAEDDCGVCGFPVCLCPKIPYEVKSFPFQECSFSNAFTFRSFFRSEMNRIICCSTGWIICCNLTSCSLLRCAVPP